MYKKIAIVLCLFALLALVPVSGVLAKPKATVRLEDIVYTNFRPAPQRLVKDREGLAFLADGLGTIHCNRVDACLNAGLDGEPVSIQQGFLLEMTLPATSGEVSVLTAGTLQLGEYRARKFKGKGEATVACMEETCFTSLTWTGNVAGGAKIIARLDIDHSSAGVINSAEGLGDIVPSSKIK